MPVVRTVWQGVIDGVEYRLTRTMSKHGAQDVDPFVVAALQKLASRVLTVEVEPEPVDDGVARWRSEEELGFAPRRRAG